jgi:hypothetical protein
LRELFREEKGDPEVDFDLQDINPISFEFPTLADPDFFTTDSSRSHKGKGIEILH